MPVNALKDLIEKPNPVPMSRWLTIGVLNPKLWKLHLGSQWTQHAGVIRADLPGDGFGGRALCLSSQTVPEGTFEIATTVRLDDEAGAAGLAFCSDGGDKHYGFYPSGGKLRLTRFDGPDVYSWTILADVPSEAYKAGEWNTLRVRVEPEKITCFVNGKQVIETDDAGLRGGMAGLCKFRTTVADFRSFRIGTDLTEKPLNAELASKFRSEIEANLAQASTRDQTLDKLLEDPAAARRVISEQRKKLEEEATKLRELAVHDHSGLAVQHAMRWVGWVGGDDRGQVHRGGRAALVCTFATQDHLAFSGHGFDHVDCAAELRDRRADLDLNAALERGLGQLLGDFGTGHAVGRGLQVGEQGPRSCGVHIERVLFVEFDFHFLS
jgi:hypothetical protein